MAGIFKFYGIDWLAMILMFYSLKALKEKKAVGFAYGGVACFLWVLFNLITGSYAGIIANIIFIYINYTGYIEWKKGNNN